MTKIEFKNLPDTSTPLSAENLNTMQDNIETAIDNVSIDLDTETSTTSTNGIENQAITNYVDNQIQDAKDYTDEKAQEVYSTDEVRIGTWINGKPIYRKIFTNVNITSSNTDLINISSLGMQNIVKIYGALFTTSSTVFPIPLTDSSSNYSVIFATSTALRGRAVIGSGTLADCWLALEYTKTTD